jgi:hypothetical protein
MSRRTGYPAQDRIAGRMAASPGARRGWPFVVPAGCGRSGSWCASPPLWHGVPKAVAAPSVQRFPWVNVGQLPGTAPRLSAPAEVLQASSTTRSRRVQTIAAGTTPLGPTCTDAIIIMAATWLIPRMSRAGCRVLIWSAAGWPRRQPVRVSVSVVAVMISWADENRRVRPCRPGEARPGGVGCRLSL